MYGDATTLQIIDLQVVTIIILNKIEYSDYYYEY